MKKFAKFLLMALLVCCVACTENGGGDDNSNDNTTNNEGTNSGNDNNGDENGDGNGGNTNVDIEFEIAVTGITSTNATVTVTPSTDDTYYFDVVDKEVLSNFYNNSIDDYVKDLLDYVQNDLQESLSDYVSSGADSYTYDDRSANTEYIAFAFGLLIDGTITSDVATVSFKTLEGSGDDGGSSGGNEGGTYEDMVLTGLNYADYENFGDYYDTNACNWLIYMDDYPDNNVLIVEVQTPLSATDFTGDYQIAGTYASGTAVNGFFEDNFLCGSYWNTYDSEGTITDYLLLMSGSVKITKSGTTYTVEVDAVSDMNTSVKAKYTGAIEEYVEESQVSPTSTLRKFSALGHKKAQKVVKRMPVSRFKVKNVR